jgi:hypothetical protein
MRRTTIMMSLAAMTLAGCATSSNNTLPLIFGQQNTLGVSMGGDASSQGVELTLGYKDRNIAFVPVVARDGAGQLQFVNATASDGFRDSFSVLGQFSAEADSRAGKVGLGKFFATGMAARSLADGFSDAIGGGAPPPSKDLQTAGTTEGSSAPEATAQPVSNPAPEGGTTPPG